ncbi:MAG: phage integrase N-terminal SAM-like domain-containing protein [Hyphomicrobiaceae bacterium]
MSTPYPKEPISPLRARMIEDMCVRSFSLATQRGYILGVKMLADFLGRSPDTATAEEARSFLAATGITPGVQNMTVSGLRFYFRFTVDKPETTRHLVYTYEPQKLPRVLSSEEIGRLLAAASEPKDKAMLSVAYGAGMHAMEGLRSRSSTSTASGC